MRSANRRVGESPWGTRDGNSGWRPFMRIGIDASCWSNRRGFGRFTRELLTSLAALQTGDEYVVFVDRQTADQAAFPTGWRVSVGATREAPSRAAAADGRRSLRDLWVMRRLVEREPLDVMFFPAVYSYFPIGGRVPCLVTFHDVIAETLPHLVFQTRRSRLFWNLKCRSALRRSRLLLTVSEASRRGLAEHFGVRADRIRILPEAASAAFRPMDTTSAAHRAALERHRVGPGERFLLYVGGISPHKNIDTLIEAFGRLGDDRSFGDVRLVLVGDYSGDVFRTCHAELSRQAARLGVDGRVHFPGYVPDEDLAHLYSAATAFVFPSYLEGFGLPAVEAMACGAPVIASNRGSLPEVLDGAGGLFEPHDVTTLVDCLRRVLQDEAYQGELRARSLRRARDFSWEQSARQTVDLFHEFEPTRPSAGAGS